MYRLLACALLGVCLAAQSTKYNPHTDKLDFISVAAATSDPAGQPCSAPIAVFGNVLYVCSGGVYVASGAPVAAGVSLFNGRAGSVALTSADVTGALTYTPVAGAASSFDTEILVASGTGGKTLGNTNLRINLDGIFRKSVTNGQTFIGGGNAFNNGAVMQIFGSTSATKPWTAEFLIGTASTHCFNVRGFDGTTQGAAVFSVCGDGGTTISNATAGSLTVVATGAGSPLVAKTHASTVAANPFMGVQNSSGTWLGGFLGSGLLNIPAMGTTPGVTYYDAAGTLQKVTGAASDCPRVDGTSGPCGGSSGLTSHVGTSGVVVSTIGTAATSQADCGYVGCLGYNNLWGGHQTYTPSAPQTLAAVTQIVPDADVVQITAVSGVTLTAVPTIATSGVGAGRKLTVQVTGSSPITLQDKGTLASSGLCLSAPTITMDPTAPTAGASRISSLQFAYSSTRGCWVQSGAAAAATSPLTTKGDLYTYDTDKQRLPAGSTSGMRLATNSALPTGLEWVLPSVRKCASVGAGTQATAYTVLDSSVSITPAVGDMIKVTAFYTHSGGVASLPRYTLKFGSVNVTNATGGNAVAWGSASLTSGLWITTMQVGATNTFAWHYNQGSTGATNAAPGNHLVFANLTGAQTLEIGGYFTSNAGAETVTLEHFCVEVMR